MEAWDEALGEVERILGVPASKVAYESALWACLQGFYVEPEVVSGKFLSIRVGKLGKTFRVVARRSSEPPGFVISLTLYGRDFGDLAFVGTEGEVKFSPWKLPPYLATPAKLITLYESDVWSTRLKTAVSGALEPVSEGPSPEVLIDKAASVAGISGGRVIGEPRLLYSLETLDYVVEVAGMKPVWYHAVTDILSFSPKALRIALGLEPSPELVFLSL